MLFKKITINNFRNFERIELNLCDKNVFFGLNDVGKTNFLYALRYLFDKEIRKQNLIDSDFYKKNTNDCIEIVVELDISEETADVQKLRAKLKGSLMSGDQTVYIKLTANFDENEMIAVPILYWGGSLDRLTEIKQHGYMTELDYVFNVIYIDSYVDLNKMFKKNINTLIKSNDEDDESKLTQIQNAIDSLNSSISDLSGIKSFEEKITPDYKKFKDEDISISVKSEIAVKGLYSNIIPYIKHADDENLYPTSGEGRKKLLVYSLYDILSDENSDRKINIFLIEEPENHLHKSMQIALSNVLFNDENYKYLFVTTHSPFVLYEMNHVNLVRIYNETKISSASYFYELKDEHFVVKQVINRALSEAVFADKVLMVEGPSEKILFEKVLHFKDPYFEVNGGYILCVNNVGFVKYKRTLEGLGIKTFIKTDNDLRKSSGEYSVLGFSRCNKIIDQSLLPTEKIKTNSITSKRTLYEQNIAILNEIRANHHVYLSKVDLENDLDECLHDRMVDLLGVDNPVEFLYEAKMMNMLMLSKKLTTEDADAIIEHYNFECLKDFSI